MTTFRLPLPCLRAVCLVTILTGASAPAIAAAPARSGETAAATRRFDVPAGSAEESLKRFSAQSGREVLFPTEVVAGVRTRAVQGEMTIDAALDTMLAGTGLVGVKDAKTGSFTVKRGPGPNVEAARAEAAPAARAASAPDVAAPQVAAKANNGDSGNDTVELSPFVVNVSQDQGYIATNTLSGTRLNTALEATPAAISEFTLEFLTDIGANNVLDAMEYSVGFAEENSQSNSNAQQFNDINLVSRGVPRSGGARSVSRNYFLWYLNGDAFNTERLSFSRGPNSVLFGIGDPGGMINTSTKQARFKTATELNFKFDSNDSWRAHVDHNHKLRDNLALRVNYLQEDRRTWREVEYYDQTRLHLAGTWRPWQKTTLRAEYESGDVDQVRARPWAGRDRFTPWVTAGRPAYNRAVNGNTYPTGVTNIGNNPYLVYDTATNSWMNWQRFGRSTPAGDGPLKIQDPNILPWEAVISGPSSSTDFKYWTYSVYLEQELARNLNLELAYNEQMEVRDVRQGIGQEQIALNIDPNVTLPSGAQNPSFGGYFIEGQAIRTHQPRLIDNLRATLAYEFDSGSPWFGRHRWVGLASREKSWQGNQRFSEVNLTPLTGAPALFSNAANAIRRRTYLDFNGGKRFFDQNPYGTWAATAINSNGATGTVTPGFYRDRWRPQQENTDSLLIAGQSHFFPQDRLALTYGFRRDELDQQSFIEIRNPVTGQIDEGRLSPVETFSGDTLTSGAVVKVMPWMMAFFNYSENFSPQSALNIYAQNLGNVEASGMDYGLRFVLLDKKLYANFGRYRTESTNRAGNTAFDYRASINGIWEAIYGQIGGPNEIFEGFNDVQDFASEGYEFEVTANLTRGLSLKANYGTLKGKIENMNVFTEGYIAANRALWQQNATRVVPSTGTTVATELARIDNLLARHAAVEGQEAENNRKKTFNLFGKYQFQEGFLKPWSVGGGARYRGPNVLGYRTDNSTIYGDSYWIADLFLSYRQRLWSKKVNLNLQLNIQNLFDKDDLIVTETTNTGIVTDYIFQTPRTITLSASFKF